MRKAVSPSVAIILGKGKPAPAGDAPEEGMEDEDAGLTSLGKALCEAVEKKDYAAIGRALKEAHEYCMPESEDGEGGEDKY